MGGSVEQGSQYNHGWIRIRLPYRNDTSDDHQYKTVIAVPITAITRHMEIKDTKARRVIQKPILRDLRRPPNRPMGKTSHAMAVGARGIRQMTAS
jgi:hypothetical protein